MGVTLGTAGIVAATINEFQINPGGTIQFFCNVIPDSWVALEQPWQPGISEMGQGYLCQLRERAGKVASVSL